MAKSNRQRVEQALTLLATGLRPFVEGQMLAAHGTDWAETVASQGWGAGGRPQRVNLDDPDFLLKLMIGEWQGVFRKVLGQSERSLVGELRDTRGKWAHNEAFTTDDAYRALDSAYRLLLAIAAPEAEEVDHYRQELLRVRFEEQARKAAARTAETAVFNAPAAGLTPWREVITPHPDVATGRYQQAEFAADLAQVHRGEGAAEYADPVEFFRRTFMTVGLERLLSQALLRLASKGGEPVVDLQTNFGGGKTHSLLALYHLFSGARPGELAGIEGVLKEAGLSDLPEPIARAVLVGTSISPGRETAREGGITVKTLWGELGWQLGGAEGYGLVAEADRTATNPGDALRELFIRFSPCLVLIDEWVAYARQLYGREDLPAGTFDAHMTFAQALTETAKAVPGVLVVVSIPASEVTSEEPDDAGIEVGGVGGVEALKRLRNVIHRADSPWQPASAEESFEIVRRRLFEPIAGAEGFQNRDATARKFCETYRSQAAEFPSECRAPDYEERIKRAYPIHPELFDRLYQDWSSLERFQRTRGVLRFMAAVTHALWESNDRAPLIMPASVPIDDAEVRYEATRHLEDNWKPVIDRDIDGPEAVPLALDRDNPNLGRYQATRRVARTIFMGSAPTHRSPSRGLDDGRIRLGCVLPGESPAIFGDALRRLTDRANFLYVDGARYWFTVQPSVGSLAQQRAERWRSDEVTEELVRWLRAEKDSADFARVHRCPGGSIDVPDEPSAGLIVLSPEYPHAAKGESSPAQAAAAEILEHRGGGQRLYKNMLAFLAADRVRIEELLRAVRQLLAWRSIEDERADLNLDEFQANQARTKRTQAEDAVRHRITEAYAWLLIPAQEKEGQLGWETVRVNGQGTLAARSARKMLHENSLITTFGSALLRLELDRVPLWRGDHVSVRQVWEDFASYPYLPRLRGQDVLLGAVAQGPASLALEAEGFGYAETLDGEGGRYLGLHVHEVPPSVVADGQSVLVRPEAALRQHAADQAAARLPTPGENGGDELDDRETDPRRKRPEAPDHPKRFYGTVRLDATRLGRDAGAVAEEIVSYLSALVGTDVELTLEVKARREDGFDDQTVRTVSENARTLKFEPFEFED